MEVLKVSMRSWSNSRKESKPMNGREERRHHMINVVRKENGSHSQILNEMREQTRQKIVTVVKMRDY